MKITNKKRLIKILIILAFFITFIVISISNKTFSHTELQYKEKYVDVGDTLWSIATEERTINSYYINKDIREIISDIRKINKLTSSNLQIGQKLEIPTI